eukprot:14985412-Heterocapsa_arctica.AAC.1
MGSPSPPNPGSHRPLVQSSVDPPSIPPNCLQCPVHINKILELQARLTAGVRASEEDQNELRGYIAREQTLVHHLRHCCEPRGARRPSRCTAHRRSRRPEQLLGDVQCGRA